MSFLTDVYALLFYVATLIFVLGLAFRIRLYARTPAPLKIPTMPAPLTQAGVTMRMAREVVLFESLFKSNKWTWIFGWLFHFSLVLAFLRHLRYAMSPDNIFWPLVNLEVVQSFGRYAGYGILVGLLGLFGRRIFVERVRYISAPSDYLMLVLLFAIAGTGMLMSFVSHTDIVSLKEFVLGLMYFEWHSLPADPLLLVHLALVASLMIIFPFSKLLHAPGVFFSPTRNQADNSRDKRHVTPWAVEPKAR
ncbi:MAG: respiratory nitrate reductase subunit gamma [Gammaproteobacteria bacterium]